MRVLPQLNHVGIYVNDIDAMTTFYTNGLNLVVTDEGDAKSVGTKVTFLSASPQQHHQLVLIQNPADHDRKASTVNQLSFKVTNLSELRALHEQIVKAGARKARPMNHGNALSIYSADPEGNGIELYMDLPWYVSQPFGDPLDLRMSDEEIFETTERRVRSEPTFRSREDWAEGLRKELGGTA